MGADPLSELDLNNSSMAHAENCRLVDEEEALLEERCWLLGTLLQEKPSDDPTRSAASEPPCTLELL